MYTDALKVFAKKKKNEKGTGDPDTNNKNMHPGYKNGIAHWKMFDSDNKEREKEINWRNRAIKSEEY